MKTRRACRLPLAALVALAALACAPDFDENLSLVDEPRLIAVRADPAEVAPEETVTLTGIVASRDGLPGDVSYSFCVTQKPLSELGPIDPACLAGDPSSVLPLGVGTRVDAPILEKACQLFGPSQLVGDDGQSIGRPADPDPTGGYYQPLLASLQGQTTVLGGVRLACGLPVPPLDVQLEHRRRFRPNTNPELAAVLRQSGADWEELPPASSEEEAPAVSVQRGAKLRLRAEWAACPASAECGDGICSDTETVQDCPDDCREPTGCTGAEPYLFYDLQTRALLDRREEIVIAWFATHGRFASARTEAANPGDTISENVWTAPRDAGVARLWAVIRDGRGGVGFRSYTIEVER